MDYTLPKAHFEQVKVQKEHTVEFEAFCRRNNIPFEIQVHNGDESVYLIRAGRDYTDAQLMVHKMGWNGLKADDPEFIGTMEILRFYYFFWIPEYEYELSLSPRNKEDLSNLDCNIPLWDM